MNEAGDMVPQAARGHSEVRSPARYLAHGDFHAALHQRVEAHFARSGVGPGPTPEMWRKTLIILAWFVASYGLLMFWASGPWQALACSVSLGLAMAGIGFNIQHDGGHGGYSARRGLNGVMAVGLDLIGGSSYIWRWKHNILHHSHPNVDGLDSDVNIQPLCRLTPAQPRRWAHRFQHIYTWLLYSFLAVKWQFFDDFKDVIAGRVGAQRIPRPRGFDLLLLLAGKAVFIGWSLGLPLLLHPARAVLLCHAAASITLSLVLSITFQLAHSVEGAAAPGLDGTRTEWAAHQVRTSADFAPKNAALTWYLGGLNYQVEHHLFPRVCHVHLKRLAPIVQATCAEHGVPYQVHPTARAALASHVRWLHQLGTEHA